MCGVPSPEKKARAHTRTHAPTRGRRADGERLPHDGTCAPGCRRGCHRRVDRPRALRNLWFSAGEELPEKSPATVTAAAAAAAAVRRRSGGGEGDRNETRSPKN